MEERAYINRNVYDILADLLTLSRSPIKKTPLRNRVAASERLLDFCVKEAGLLEELTWEDTLMYRTSVKGLQYLKVYDSLRQVMRQRMPIDTIFEDSNSNF